MSDLDTRVGTFLSRVEAQLARAKLGAHGIEARMEADDAGGAYPQLQGAGVRVLVRAADADRAVELLGRPEPAPEDAPGNLAEAEAAVRGGQPPRRGLLVSPLVDTLLLLTLGAIAGLTLCEPEPRAPRGNAPPHSGARAIEENRESPAPR